MAFPTAATTGLPDGVKLTASGDIIVTKAGTVLSNLNVTGQIWVRAENVTIQNCKITSSNYYGVRIDQGLKGVTVQNSEINGQGKVLNGIGGAGTFLNNNIYGCENGINVEGPVATRIEGNYIHGFKGSASAHFDGIQIFGDSRTMGNIEVVHNTVVQDADHTGVSAIFVANTFGPVNNVNIHDNYFSGGGFPLYFDGTKSSAAMTNVAWNNNYVVKGGYGYEYIRADSQGHKPGSAGNTMIAGGLSPDKAPDKYAGGTTPTPTPDPTPTPTPTPTPDPAPAPEKIPGHIYGTDGKDTWLGGTTGESYHGGKGDDLINGRGGSDTLWGGEGRDTFQFSDRWSAYGDKVMDFTKGEDKLDFHLIDANLSRAGDQAFIWDGYKSASYNGSVQHMWAVKDTARDVTHVYFKIDGNVSYVDLAGTNHNLTASDFYL